MPEAVEKVEVVESELPAKQTETKVETTQQEEDSKKVEKEVSFDTDEIAVNEEGELVFTDPDDPNGIVYKGKDMNELLKNIRNGVKEKNKYIKELKSKEKVTPETFKKTPPQKEVDDVPVPDYKTIMRETVGQYVKENDVDPQKLNWGDQEWNQYQTEHELKDWQLAREMQTVDEARKQIRQQAETTYSEKNIAFINAKMLDAETVKVRKLLTTSGISPEDFDYDGVLERVYKNPENKNELGLIESGSVVEEAANEIMRLSKTKSQSKLSEKIEKTVEEAKKVKAQIKTPISTSKQVEKEKEKAPTDYEEAKRRARALFT